MHQQAHDFVDAHVRGLPDKLDVIEVGARDVNGGIRDTLLSDWTYTGVDITDGPGVDVVADAATWTPKRKAGLVICCEVLEHTPDWQAIVTNMAGWLRKKGRLVVTAACDPRAPHSAVDGGPIRSDEHYANIDPTELQAVLAPFGAVEVEVDEQAGDVRAVLVKK